MKLFSDFLVAFSAHLLMHFLILAIFRSNVEELQLHGRLHIHGDM